jgi:hypothetical protein
VRSCRAPGHSKLRNHSEEDVKSLDGIDSDNCGTFMKMPSTSTHFSPFTASPADEDTKVRTVVSSGNNQ